MSDSDRHYLSVVNEYGDPKELSFIGLLEAPTDRRVYAYMRCMKHSKRIQADQLIHKYVTRNVQPTIEQKAEIAEMLIAAQSEGHKKNFVIGSPLEPGKGTTALILAEERGRIYITVDGPLIGGKLHNPLWLLSTLQRYSDVYKSYETLVAALKELVAKYPDDVKWITSLEEDFYGTYS